MKPPLFTLVLTVVTSLATAVLQTGCGSISHAMKPADKSQAFRRPVVISLLGDELRLKRMGITIFEEKMRKVPVPDWRLDEMVEQLTVARLRSQGIEARSATPTLRAMARQKTWSKTFDGPSDMKFDDFVRENPGVLGGADSAVLIQGVSGKVQAGQAHAPALVYFSVTSDVAFVGAVRVFNYTAQTGRMLSWAHGNDTGAVSGKIPFRSWEEATPDQRAEIRAKIVEATQKSLQEALRRSGL